MAFGFAPGRPVGVPSPAGQSVVGQAFHAAFFVARVPAAHRRFREASGFNDVDVRYPIGSQQDGAGAQGRHCSASVAQLQWFCVVGQ